VDQVQEEDILMTEEHLNLVKELLGRDMLEDKETLEHLEHHLLTAVVEAEALEE
jgi:hypothetical protein